MRPLAPAGRSVPSSRILRAVTLTMGSLACSLKDARADVTLFARCPGPDARGQLRGASHEGALMTEPTVEALYEQVRASLPEDPADPGGGQPALLSVAPGIRVLALRTPTLPPAAHTNVYLV